MGLIIKDGNKIIDALKSDIYIQNPKQYKFLFDKDHDIDTFNTDNKFVDKTYKLHDDVLPQPYFGDVYKKIDVLFVAKNPAYTDYKDAQDTFRYLNRHGGYVTKYYEHLKNVNFLKPWYEGENISFVNSWNWWNDKVLGRIELVNKETNVVFINLCGYQSKYFHKKHFKTYPTRSKSDFENLIANSDLVFVVWNGIGECVNLPDNNKTIVLNLNSKETNNKEFSSGTNINSLETILRAKNFIECYENGQDYPGKLEEKQKYEKISKIYNRNQMNLINEYFVLKYQKNN